MPISYRFDAPNQLVHCTAQGVITLNELEEHNNRLQTDSAFTFRATARVLWDFTATTHFDHSAARYVQVAESWLAVAKSRRALVASSAGEVWKFLSLWVLHRAARRDPRVRLFDSMDKARQWLDQPD